MNFILNIIRNLEGLQIFKNQIIFILRFSKEVKDNVHVCLKYI